MPSLYSEKNLLHLLTILESIEKIQLYASPYEDAEGFFRALDQQPFNATCHLLLAVGEETGKLDNSLKEEFAFIAWEQISGLRNPIAHDYRSIDADIVFQVIKYELGPLKEVGKNMLRLLGVPKDKLNVFLSSEFFKHIEYLKN